MFFFHYSVFPSSQCVSVITVCFYFLSPQCISVITVCFHHHSVIPITVFFIVLSGVSNGRFRPCLMLKHINIIFLHTKCLYYHVYNTYFEIFKFRFPEADHNYLPIVLSFLTASQLNVCAFYCQNLHGIFFAPVFCIILGANLASWTKNFCRNCTVYRCYLGWI